MTKAFLSMLLAAGLALTITVTQAHATEMDNRVESAAKDSYVFKTYLKDDHITVNSKDGMVTLTGDVANDGHKSLAENTVENLPGVTSVNNQLAVTNPSTPENSDAWLGLKVKTALLFRRNINGLGTKVSVKDGLVTLNGDVQTQAQKDLTGLYASEVDGVKTVDNQLAVVPSAPTGQETFKDKIDDASITAQVKMTLLFNRSTSALKTKVETQDGVVTLSGPAKDAAEKDLVTQLVSDINGVVNVVNNMDVSMPHSY